MIIFEPDWLEPFHSAWWCSYFCEIFYSTFDFNSFSCSRHNACFNLFSRKKMLNALFALSQVVCGACLRLHAPRGTRLLTGGESMTAPRMKCSLAPTHQRWAWGYKTGCKYCFASLPCNQCGNGTLHTSLTPHTSFGGVRSTYCTGWHKKNGHHRKSNNFQNFIQIDTKLQLH